MRKQNFSVGVLDVNYIRGGGFDPFTKRWFVDPVNGSDGNEGKSISNAKKTFAAGYAKCTENKNEALYIVGGASALAQTAILSLSKDYTHIIGLAAPIATGGRVRFTNSITTATTGEFVSDTVGSIYANLHFQYGELSATAGDIVGFGLNGERNYFENCHFQGPIDATIGAAAGQTMLKITGVQDNKFKKCSFGQRTILNTSSTGSVIWFAGSNVSNNEFEECEILSYNNNTGASFVKFSNNAMPDSGYTLFRRCNFLTTVSNNMADAILFLTAGHGSVFLDYCTLMGAGLTKWTTNFAANVFVTGPASSATGGMAV